MIRNGIPTGCLFPEYNMPQKPLHPNCHCRTEKVNQASLSSDCPIVKFENYIFNESVISSKKALFIKWGYGIIDSQQLKAEFEKQALQKYAEGDFKLNKLDPYGQRITIAIVLPYKDKSDIVVFKSGWMVYPDGHIVLATPFSGVIK